MPDDGVPMHMMLYPRNNPEMAVYCRGSEMAVYRKDAWDEEGPNGLPLLRLSWAKAAALAWFLRYWLGAGALRPGYDMPDVLADFEF